MTEEAPGPTFPRGGPAGARPGWYRDRTTGHRRYWNGATWIDLADLVTPFPFQSKPPVAPLRSPPPPLATTRGTPLQQRRRAIVLSLAAVVAILAILAVSLSNTGTTRSTARPGATATTGAGSAAKPPATTSVSVPPAPTPVPAVAAAPTTLGSTSETGGGNGSCPPQTSLAVTAEPDTVLDHLFQAYGDSGTGATWTGGDGTESVSLPDGRELWFFSDSYLGSISNGQRTLSASHLTHNMLVIERAGVLRSTRHKGSKNAPQAFLNPVPEYPTQYGFWPGSMVVNGATLQVIGLDVTFSEDGAYTVTGNSLATFALPKLNLLGLQTLPISQTDWSGGTLRDGGYTYLYGSALSNTYAARVPGTDLTVPWSYYDGGGWTSDPGAAVPIENLGTKSHFSVSKVGSLYVFITKSSWTTHEITSAFGCSPVGPFGPPQPIYTPRRIRHTQRTTGSSPTELSPIRS
jgi:hypothetical protein